MPLNSLSDKANSTSEWSDLSSTVIVAFCVFMLIIPILNTSQTPLNKLLYIQMYMVVCIRIRSYMCIHE
jgi:hypothetical protein